MKPIHSLALLGAALLACAGAQAQDNVFKVGPVRYDTHSKTDSIRGWLLPGFWPAKISSLAL